MNNKSSHIKWDDLLLNELSAKWSEDISIS